MKKFQSLFAVVIFIMGCGGGNGDTVVEAVDSEIIEPEICHEPEEIIRFLRDAQCSSSVIPWEEDCVSDDPLIRMIKAPVLRVATHNIRDEEMSILKDVIALINEALPDRFDISLGDDLDAVFPNFRIWSESLSSVPSGEIHMSFLGSGSDTEHPGRANWRSSTDNGQQYIDAGIIRMDTRKPFGESGYECDRFIGQVMAHEIMHILGFIGHVAWSWNHTATDTEVDRIPAVTVMGTGTETCGNEGDELNRFSFPLEHMGSMDKAALNALYSMHLGAYPEEFYPEEEHCE